MPPQGIFTGSLPEMYERYLVAPLFRPFAEVLLDRAGVAAGHRVLDVACGTGIVARLARERVGEHGRVVGVDLSPGMIAMARSVAPAVDWREGDSARLPVAADETFDVVTCHQGLQFFADKAAAAREWRRVLGSGGRLAVATWRPVDETPLVQDLHRVAERHLGPYTDQRHSFGDARAMETLLTEAGFRAVQSETVTRPIRMIGGATVFPSLNTMAVVGMNAAAKAMSEERRAQVVSAIGQDSTEAVKPYLQGDDIVFDLHTNITIAQG